MTRIPPSSFRFVCQYLLSAVLLFGSGYAKADAGYPLESVDTSSPRATLTSFFAELEGTWEVFRDEYGDTPSYEIYLDIIHGAGRTLRTLDLSEVAPSARIL